MSSRWMLRAAAEPERFLSRGFARLLARHAGALRRRRSARAASVDLKLTLPPDLATFLDALGGASLAGFVPRPKLPRWPTLAGSARGGSRALARLVALLAGGVPFGETDDGDLVVYLLADEPARGIVAIVDPDRLTARPFCRGAAELAAILSLHAFGAEVEMPSFGLAETEAVRALFARARALAAVVTGSDAQLRSAVRALDRKPLDVPPPEPERAGARGKAEDRYAPLALGALVEAFFREPGEAVREHLALHARSSDELVRGACAALARALCVDERARAGAAARELARRRALALRALRLTKRSTTAPDALETTRRIVAHLEQLPPSAESFTAAHEREEALLALAALGDRRIVPELFARASAGDASAVEMLAALGDGGAVRQLLDLAARAPKRGRAYDVALVRALAAVGAKDATPKLRQLLEDNPLTGWREGLERGRLVRELVVALGELEDAGAAGQLVGILESTSHEYRAVLPAAAHALGALRYAPALPALERLLASPKEPIRCETVWAVGALGRAHPAVRERTRALLERLTGLEPGAEATRLSALAMLRAEKRSAGVEELRRAIGRALWEPAFRQEETSRQRVWALRAIEDLASTARADRANAHNRAVAAFLGHEAVRYFLTRDDHRVRHAAKRAFSAWHLSVPAVRHYFSFALPDLEARGGLEALREAVRDPLGVFRYNVARRLAELGDPRSTRALAEATARVFAEPPTSTYEYDDAPPHLVAFVRALAKLNAREGNDVLIEALRSNHHQVRAVVAENAPNDERFVPELMAMLHDSRSFLRSRAEKSLISLGVLPAAIDPTTTEVPAVSRLVGA